MSRDITSYVRKCAKYKPRSILLHKQRLTLDNSEVRIVLRGNLQIPKPLVAVNNDDKSIITRRKSVGQVCALLNLNSLKNKINIIV